MPLDNVPKNIIETYWKKYSDDRKRISESIREALIVNKFIISILREIGWVIYQPYKWLFVIPFLGISTIVFGIFAIITSIVINPVAGGKFAVLWAKLNSYFTPMSVNVEGLENIDENQSYVIVANHLSLYDIYVLYGWIGIDIRWVMKKELRKVPIIGFVCKTLQHIYIDRSSSEKAIESINKAKEKICNGTSVIFFPEGTRSCDFILQPFKKGAFKLAIDLGLPVLPVTINGTHKILSKGSTNLMPGTAEMIIHKVIDTSDYNGNTINDLIKKSRDVVKSRLLD